MSGGADSLSRIGAVLASCLALASITSVNALADPGEGSGRVETPSGSESSHPVYTVTDYVASSPSGGVTTGPSKDVVTQPPISPSIDGISQPVREVDEQPMTTLDGPAVAVQGIAEATGTQTQTSLEPAAAEVGISATDSSIISGRSKALLDSRESEMSLGLGSSRLILKQRYVHIKIRCRSKRVACRHLNIRVQALGLSVSKHISYVRRGVRELRLRASQKFIRKLGGRKQPTVARISLWFDRQSSTASKKGGVIARIYLR